MVWVLGFGMATVAFTLSVIIYIRKQKANMRRSVLRYERIKKKLED